MNDDRIDFISEYCDRWCERCAFTMRCSAYAVHVAVAMCDGDMKAAIELAVGKPRSADGTEEPEPKWRQELLDADITDEQLKEFTRHDDEQRDRIERESLSIVASGTTDLVVSWLEANRDRLHADATPEIANALDIVSWDAYLIGAKIHRAMTSHDDVLHGEDFDDDPIQNDWNGSAKVALISIGRSADACDVIARATGDVQASVLSGELRDLAREVERAFPDAWRFGRPGFDSVPDAGGCG